MQYYRDYAPSAHDVKGLNCSDKQHWLVFPYNRTRDSETNPVVASNWEVITSELAAVDDLEECHEVCSFGHWACGWFEIILIRPHTRAHEVALSLADRLDTYPLLDEDKVSELEHEETCQAWDEYGLRETLTEAGLCDDAIDAVEEYDALNGSAACIVEMGYDSGPTFYLDTDTPEWAEVVKGAWVYHLAGGDIDKLDAAMGPSIIL